MKLNYYKNLIRVLAVWTFILGADSLRGENLFFNESPDRVTKNGGGRILSFGKDKLMVTYSNKIIILEIGEKGKFKIIQQLHRINFNDAILYDVNKDGFIDIIFAGYTTSISGGERMKKGVGGIFYGSKNGFDSEAELFEASDKVYGYSVTVGDINGDGVKDIIFSIRKGGLVVFSGKNVIRSIFDKPLLIDNSILAGSYIIAADFDNDKSDEIAVARFSKKHSIHKYDKTTKQLKQVWESAKKGQSPTFLCTADLNKDGRPDLIQGGVGYARNSKVQIFLSGKQTYFNTKADYGFTPAKDEYVDRVVDIIVTDLNKDGNPDLIVGTAGQAKNADFGGKIFFLLNQGDGKFSVGQKIKKSGSELTLLDVNGDAKKDLLASNILHHILKRIKIDPRNLYIHYAK